MKSGSRRKSLGAAAAGTAVFLGLALSLTGGAEGVRAQADANLPALLDKLTAYADRLEGAVLDFVCREEIVEKISYALDQAGRNSRPLNDWSVGGAYGISWMNRPSAKVKRTYVYDYQCVRSKAGLIKETRTLLEDDGKKVEVRDAKLKTEVFVYGTPLLGPVGIFAAWSRFFYEYRIVGKDKIDRKPALIVEAVPIADRPGATNLYGRAWVGEADGEILKIEWSESRVGKREIFEERAERYGLKPRLTLRSEFSAERNGIRFPSKLWIEEAYLNERGRVFVRSETTVAYKDFKFFTVEVGDIEIR